MPANTPEEICTLFSEYMAEGNLEGLLSLYEEEAVFLTSCRMHPLPQIGCPEGVAERSLLAHDKKDRLPYQPPTRSVILRWGR
jgi:hypothetical protein